MSIFRKPVLSPLKTICVGTGRDGTSSVFKMVKDVFASEGRGRTVEHEWEAVQFYQEFCNFKETRDPKHIEAIREMIANCPYDCIVGNGYAPVLPLFREVLGKNLTLMHLRRHDRSACVMSLVQNAELFPINHRYYANSDQAAGKRVAAFHYDELTSQAWETLSVRERFEWYYDKTHQLIEGNSKRFKRYVRLFTESLDLETTRHVIAAAINSDIVPSAVHVNRHVSLDAVPAERRSEIQQLVGKLDPSFFSKDDLYGVKHFMDGFLRNATSDVLKLEQSAELLRDYLKRIEMLKAVCATRPPDGIELVSDALVAESTERPVRS